MIFSFVASWRINIFLNPLSRLQSSRFLGSMDAGDDFDIAEFFEEEAPIRISTLSSEKMIAER